ncbi:MAG: hypothetical protein D6820_08585, partial [Lentisphaerae bacterium]
PNVRNFWLDTPQAYFRLVQETAAAIRRANPRVRVAMGGITGTGMAFLESLLKGGVDKLIDIYTLHAPPQPAMALLRKYGVAPDKPVWHTEVHEMLATDIIGHYQKNFLFLFRAFAKPYEEFPAIVDREGNPNQFALTYSTMVHVLGDDARLCRSIHKPGMELGVWERAGNQILTWKSTAPWLIPGTLKIRVETVPGETPALYDEWGRVLRLPQPDSAGCLNLAISGVRFLTGVRNVKLVSLIAPKEPPDPEQYYFNAVKHGSFPSWTKLGPAEGYEPKTRPGNLPFSSISGGSRPINLKAGRGPSDSVCRVQEYTTSISWD